MISLRILLFVGIACFLVGVFLQPVLLPEKPTIREFQPEGRAGVKAPQEKNRQFGANDRREERIDPKQEEKEEEATEDLLEDLLGRKLLVPVKGIGFESVKDSFREGRGDHLHEAVDILAPKGTPVVAVSEGKIVKLFYSVRGGITIYQFDSSEKYAFYYAHLDKYADDIEEGEDVEKGEIIGYVGTTGNAPKDTPHLHFAIFKLNSDKRWWEGTAIDPYPVLKK
jgi:murein DD-endopeptidase MepM/ murein hydrolase activator NlpD